MAATLTRPPPRPLRPSVTALFNHDSNHHNTLQQHDNASTTTTTTNNTTAPTDGRPPFNSTTEGTANNANKPALPPRGRRKEWRQSMPAASARDIRNQFEAEAANHNHALTGAAVPESPSRTTTIREHLFHAFHHHNSEGTAKPEPPPRRTTVGATGGQKLLAKLQPDRSEKPDSLKPSLSWRSSRHQIQQQRDQNGHVTQSYRGAPTGQPGQIKSPFLTNNLASPPKSAALPPVPIRERLTLSESSAPTQRQYSPRGALPTQPPVETKSSFSPSSSMYANLVSSEEAAPATAPPINSPPMVPVAQSLRSSASDAMPSDDPSIPESPHRRNTFATLPMLTKSATAPSITRPFIPPLALRSPSVSGLSSPASSSPRTAPSVPPRASGPGTPRGEFRMVLDELINTEAGYVTDLVVLTDVWMRELHNRNLLSESEIVMIFSNIDQIKQLNTQLLASLTELGLTPLAQLDFSGIATFMEFLKLYAEYCTNYVNATERLETLQRNNNELAATLEEIRQRPECKLLDIYSFMIKPLQRLTKYPLLLHQLMKALPDTHAHYPSLKDCFDRITCVVGEINEKQREAEERHKMLAIQVRLDTVVLMPHRKIVKTGMFKRVQGSNSKDPFRKCHLFLFNDGLLLAKEKTKKGKKLVCKTGGIIPWALISVVPGTPSVITGAQPVQLAPLSPTSQNTASTAVTTPTTTVSTATTADVDGKQSFSIVRTDTNDKFTVFVDSASEKQEWLSAILDCGQQSATSANLLQSQQQSPSNNSSNSSSNATTPSSSVICGAPAYTEGHQATAFVVPVPNLTHTTTVRTSNSNNSAHNSYETVKLPVVRGGNYQATSAPVAMATPVAMT